MFKYLLKLLIVLLIYNHLIAQGETGKRIFINEHVGTEIDRQERQKYDLFTDVTGFQSADYILMPDKSYILEITFIDENTGELKVNKSRTSLLSINDMAAKINDFEMNQEMKAGSQEAYISPGAAFFIELGGKPFYSVNIDFQIMEMSRLSIGTQYAYKIIIPNVMYYGLRGERNSKFEYGAGMSYLPIDTGKWDEGLPLLIHGVLGYRYQKKNGFIFRAGFTPIIFSGGFLPMFGISFGYSL